MSNVDKKLWKRVWWTLFTRDRMVAAALGRPTMINTGDSDVPMLSEADFFEGEPADAGIIPPNAEHVQFFLNLVKLCEIMGIVLLQQYAPKIHLQNRTINLTHSDMALASWMMKLPSQMRYNPQDRANHEFFPALLHSFYYTALCMLHRVNMGRSRHDEDPNPYPSRNIAFTAATMISRIIENVGFHGQLRYMPAFSVHTVFSALVMQIYQLKSLPGSDIEMAQKHMDICMTGLNEIANQWSIGKTVFRLLAAVRSSPVLVARMQKALQTKAKASEKGNMKSKITFEEAGTYASPNFSSQNVSFERGSCPTSPKTHQEPVDGFLGIERLTRPSSPFTPTLSGPTSPPQDLYLVTRSEPPIEESLYESFQPTHLFPQDLGLYQQIQQQQAAFQQLPMMESLDDGTKVMPQVHSRMGMWHPALSPWSGTDGSPSNVSTNSSCGQAAPTSFNVEDWYQYFGFEKVV